MGEAELRTFEAFCDTLYTSPNAEERNKAEAALVQLSTTPEYIPRCQFVLSNSQMPYAQLVASNALKKLLQTSWNHLTPPQRVEYRNYALNFLANQGPGLQGFVAASLVQLVACVTKLGWMEIEDHTQVLHEVGRFLHIAIRCGSARCLEHHVAAGAFLRVKPEISAPCLPQTDPLVLAMVTPHLD